MATLEERIAAKMAAKEATKGVAKAAPSLDDRIAAKKVAREAGAATGFDAIPTEKVAVDPDSVGSSIGRAVDNMQAGFGGTAEAIGEITGSEGLAEWGGQYRDEQQAEASQYGQPSISSYKQVEDWGDAGSYAKELGLSSVPAMGTILGSGAAAAKVAPMALKPAAAILGSLGASLGINIGDVQNKIKEIDPEAKSTMGSILAGGAISVLDVTGAALIAKPLLKTLGKDLAEEMLIQNGVKQSVAKGAVKAAAIGGAGEAATGATQSVIGDVAAASATDTEVQTEKLWENAVNAAIGGGIIGTPLGAAIGATAADSSNGLEADTAVDMGSFEDGKKTKYSGKVRAFQNLGTESTKLIEPLARNASEAKKFLRMFRADMTGREASDTTITEDARMMAGGWRQKLETLTEEVGGKKKFNEMLDDYMNNPEPTSPAAVKFKGLMDEIHTYAKTEGRLEDIGKIERFVPISADPAKVRENYDQFLQDILPSYGGDVTKATAAIDTWLEKSDQPQSNTVPNVHRLVDIDPATGELVIDDSARFDPADPDTMKFKFSQGQIPPENTHLEKTRTFGKVPQAVLAKYAKEQDSKERYNAVSDYIETVAHRLAFTKRFGKRGERANAMIAKAVRQAQAAGYRPSKTEITRMFDILDAYNGMLGNIKEQGWKEASSIASAGLAIKTLPLAGLSTLVEVMTPSTRFTITDAVASAAPAMAELARAGVRKMFVGVPKSEFGKIASDAGLSLSAATNVASQRLGVSYMTRGAAKATTAFFLINGLTLITHATRIYAAKTADRVYMNSLRNLSTGIPLTSARAQKDMVMLRSLGLEVRSTEHAKALFAPSTRAEIEEARRVRTSVMHRGATQSVLEPGVTDVPMWMSDNRFQLLALLHRYPSAFTNTLLPQMIRRASPGWNGGALKAGQAAVGSMFIVGMMLALGYVQDELKMILKTGEVDYEDIRTEEQRFHDVVSQTIMPVHLSWPMDFINAPRYGSTGLGSMSPATGFVTETGMTLYNIWNNPEEGKIYQYLYKQTPAGFFRPGREAVGELEFGE